MMRSLLDRVTLIAVAGLLLGTLVWTSLWSQTQNIASDWNAFGVFSVFWFGVIGYLTVMSAKANRTRLRKRWPLVVAYLIIMAIHVAVLSTIIYRYEPKWHALGWLAIFACELPIIVLAMDWAFEYSGRD